MAEGDVYTLLIVDPDAARRQELHSQAKALGCHVALAATSEEAWPTFADMRPSVVFLGLCGDDGNAAEIAQRFLRKLQTQFLGKMPRVYFIGTPNQLGSSVLRPESLLVPPLSREILESIIGVKQTIGDTTARQIARLRELYELTALASDVTTALDVLVSRTCLTFRVDNCVIWGTSDDIQPRLARTVLPENVETLFHLCRTALDAEVPTVISTGIDPTTHTHTFLAAKLGDNRNAKGGGGICLIANGVRLFSPEEIDALRAFARRLAHELTYVGAHHRLLTVHNRLRESALLDPLLSVWTRAAFERAVVRQISSSRRRNETLHLAVFDFVRLRSVNDRHGHLAGDGALAHFARTVRDGLRAQDHVGRFGGDELAVLLVGSDGDGAQTAIQKVIDRLEESPFVTPELRIQIEVSVGLTRILANEVSGERAFSRALAARNRARRAHQRLEISTPNELGESGNAESSLVFDVSAYSSIPTGSTIGGMYRVLHEISRGAMGVVYRGEDLGLGRPVAIKVLRSDLASDRKLVSRFRDEAAVLAALRHRNLVQVFAFGEDGDDVFFVMELVEGQPLSDVIDHLTDSNTSISTEAVLKIVDEIAEALEAIHAKGIIHRDVKPANILLDRINDRAVLVDVGVAKRTHEVGDAAGTPGFAAPESFTEVPETSATDVYGLATTTYAMLTGVPPFGGGEILAVVNSQLFDPIPPPSSKRLELPHQVDAVMLKALAPAPGDRYQSATAFSISLARALSVLSRKSERMAARSTPEPSFEMPYISLPGNSLSTTTDTRPTDEAATLSDSHSIVSISPTHRSRGAFFAVARKLLIHQLGAAVVEALTDSSNSLAALLDPSLRQSGWYPSAGLVKLLTAAGPRAKGGSEKLARRLGRSVISATLAHLFGADPSSVGPAVLLSACTSFWSKYHNWGDIRVNSIDTNNAQLMLASAATHPLLCQLTVGMLGRIPELAGARAVSVEHTTCLSRGDSDCRFELTWTG